ncbi:MAG: hypothetical protein F6K42_35810 [Leptolyngbya sp. SIO1D8]|nr:hypothetical protein [Leptolyngbya sp. SIO1D8]
MACRIIVVHLDNARAADLIQQRQTARQQHDFATADDICDQLAAVGITVVDQPDGSVHIKSTR